MAVESARGVGGAERHDCHGAGPGQRGQCGEVEHRPADAGGAGPYRGGPPVVQRALPDPLHGVPILHALSQRRGYPAQLRDLQPGPDVRQGRFCTGRLRLDGRGQAAGHHGGGCASQLLCAVPKCEPKCPQQIPISEWMMHVRRFWGRASRTMPALTIANSVRASMFFASRSPAHLTTPLGYQQRLGVLLHCSPSR
jgi:hypothetical protein